MEQANTCCFTGHRPDKLPWGTDERDPRCTRLKERLGQALERAYQSGCRHFICGMARGADLYFAEAVLALRACFPQVTLEGARPCESQADRWPREEPGPLQATWTSATMRLWSSLTMTGAAWQGGTGTMVDRSCLDYRRL